MLTLIAASTTAFKVCGVKRGMLLLGFACLLMGCSPYRIAGTLAGKAVAAKIAPHLPGPKAKIIVKESGGSFCGAMTALGWPLHATPDDKALIKQLSRGTKEPILGAQLHGRAECPAWSGK